MPEPDTDDADGRLAITTSSTGTRATATRRDDGGDGGAVSAARVEGVDVLDPWLRHLCAPLTGRKVIVAFELLAGMNPVVQQLRLWGAERPLLLADGRGTGPVPDEQDADIVMLPMPEHVSLTEQVRARMRSADRLSPEVVAAVETYDPTGEAVWWVSPVGLNDPMLGRPVIGGRPPAQARLEDKLVVDGLLEAVDAPRAPTRIARAAYDDLMRATLEVTAETGVEQVVWAGDNRDGTNGGGDYIRWVRSIEQAREAAAFFADNCDQVRISAFLDGVPCSVHGIVLPDGVIALRPVELVSLRDVEAGRFVYAGMGTTWDPPQADTAEMRDLVKRVGAHLQETRGFRGAFGLDGVLTVEGFRVTELNARFSGGMTRLHRTAVEARLELVHVNAVLGRDVRKPAAAIEEHALALLDENRFVDAMGLSSRPAVAEHLEVLVRAGDGRLEQADGDASIIGSVVAGPSASGSFYRFVALDGIVQVGERAAPLSVLLHEFANRTWDAGLPYALMPPDVRSDPTAAPRRPEPPNPSAPTAPVADG